jgi:hypothetical protein
MFRQCGRHALSPDTRKELIMNTISRHAKHATVMLDPRGQTNERVHAIVDEIFKLSGCLTCGRAAVFHVDFISDPQPEFAKNGVTSIQTQGF